MEILLIISTPLSAPIVEGIAKAANRAGIKWAAFFTNDGVKTLRQTDMVAVMKGAATAIACQESWQIHMGMSPCPIELGSQTNHSALASMARRIISL